MIYLNLNDPIKKLVKEDEVKNNIAYLNDTYKTENNIKINVLNVLSGEVSWDIPLIYKRVEDKIKLKRSTETRWQAFYKDLDWGEEFKDLVIENKNNILSYLWFKEVCNKSYPTYNICCAKSRIPKEFLDDLDAFMTKNVSKVEENENYQLVEVERGENNISVYILSEKEDFDFLDMINEYIKKVTKIKDIDKNIFKEKLYPSQWIYEKPVKISLKDVFEQWQRNIDTYRAEIENTRMRYSEYLRRYDNAVRSRPDVDKMVSEFAKAVQKYEDKNFISFEREDEQTTQTYGLLIKVTTPIFNYDEALAERIYSGNALNREHAKILKNIFIDQKYEVWTETRVRLNLSSFYVNRAERFDRDRRFGRDMLSYLKKGDLYVPNPHIYGFNCFGQNGATLNDLLANYRYDEFFLALKATCGNLSLGDVTVRDEFFMFYIWSEAIRRAEIKHIKRLSDGEFISGEQFKKEINE